MRIGTLAATCGLTAKTIRFYESRGLVPPPPRTPSGYRDYPEHTIRRLQFIRHAQAAGLTLAELGSVLAIRDRGEAPCGHVTALLDEHLRAVDRRLAELRKTRAVLRELTSQAATVDPTTCGEDGICAIIRPAAEPGPPD